MSVKWIIAGLGNPGNKYQNNRHNVGFLAIDALCEQLSIKCNKLKFQSLYGISQEILLLKPQTFMNLSGRSIREATSFYKINPENTIVIFDDITLPVGKIKIKPKGSDGGHNGIKSCLFELKSENFIRVKIGVGEKPNKEMVLADWVLTDFSSNEMKSISQAVKKSVTAVETIINSGLDNAMNKCNGE